MEQGKGKRKIKIILKWIHRPNGTRFAIELD
jgi:hypothetical protein